jgi:hypothetical protein
LTTKGHRKRIERTRGTKGRGRTELVLRRGIVVRVRFRVRLRRRRGGRRRTGEGYRSVEDARGDAKME